MNEITQQTRDAAYQHVLPLAANRQERAFQALQDHSGGLTAGEVAELTGLTLNNARSALTELFNQRRVATTSKRLSTHLYAQQKTKVAVWTIPLAAS